MRSRSGGFTLLEVMVATAIAAIAIVGVLELYAGSMHLAGASARQTEALILGRSLMDEALWRSDLDDAGGSGEEGRYRWQRTIEAMEPQLGATAEEPRDNLSDAWELKEIAVTVSWQTPGGVDKSVRLVSERLVEKF